MGKKLYQWLAGLICVTGPLANQTAAAPAPAVAPAIQWKEFHSVAGKCTMIFPDVPEHVSEKMVMRCRS